MSNKADTALGSNCKKSEIMGHPRGLAYIVFTEAWERFSFYGMQALLVLYMVRYLYVDGHSENVIGFDSFRYAVEAIFGSLSSESLAKQTAGLYIGLIYLVPIFGGLLGDRVIGRTRAVLIGAFFMALGHFLMAVESAFLFALTSLIIGSGLLKGNLAAQVGALYEQADQRRDTAFSLYNVSINVGAMVAPLVCGTLGELYGWHYGFGAAGIGMLVGIGIYFSGRHYLPVDTFLDKNVKRSSLQAGDVKVIGALILILIIASFYWTVQTQVWITYPLWLSDRVDHTVFGWVIPVTWFQSLDTLAVLVFAPLIMWHWHLLAKKEKEPVVLMKLIKGFMAFGFAFCVIVWGEFLADENQVNIIWPVLFHFICGWGFMHVGPIIMALISRSAPAPINTVMISSYYLSIFAGGTISGWLGKFYETMPPTEFWLMHAFIVTAGGLFIIVFYRPLSKILINNSVEKGDEKIWPLIKEAS